MQVNSNNLFLFKGVIVSPPKFHTWTTTDKAGNDREDAVVRFTMVLEGGKDGCSKEKTRLTFEAWDSAADILAEYKVGDKIGGEGMLRNNKWKDKTTNEERSATVVRMSSFYEIDIRSRDNQNFDSYPKEKEMVVA